MHKQKIHQNPGCLTIILENIPSVFVHQLMIQNLAFYQHDNIKADTGNTFCTKQRMFLGNQL